MNLLRIAVAAVLATGLCGALQAQNKKADTKSLIVGVWELTNTAKGGPPIGTTMEFTKDGNLKLTSKADGMELIANGKYVVEGNKFTGTLKIRGNEEKGTSTIRKLTDTELVTEDEAGRVLEFKRKP